MSERSQGFKHRLQFNKGWGFEKDITGFEREMLHWMKFSDDEVNGLDATMKRAATLQEEAEKTKSQRRLEFGRYLAERGEISEFPKKSEEEGKEES